MAMNSKKRTKLIIRCVMAAVILACTIGIFTILVVNSTRGVRNQSPVHSVLTAEAGAEFELSDFLQEDAKKEGLTCSAAEGGRYDLSTPGDYALTLELSNGERYDVTLKVRDTVPPAYIEMPIRIVKRGSAVTADMLMPQECIIDATAVKVSFRASSVSTNKIGTYTAPLILTDAGRNRTTVENARYFVTENYNDEYYYEIGDPAPTIEDLLPSALVEHWQCDNFTPREPAKVLVRFTMNGREYFLQYDAKDTVPPQATVRDGDFTYFVGETPPDPRVFVDYFDQTEVTVAYDQDYAFNKAEHKKLNIVLTDAGGNSTTVSVFVSVVEDPAGGDLIPPVISGLKDISTEPDIKPNYLENISVFDNVDGVIPVERVKVDDSKVDYKAVTAGAGYEVTYTVSDSSGNVTVQTIRVKVVQSVLPDEELDIFFSQIIGEIGSPADLKTKSRFTVISSIYRLLTEKYTLKQSRPHTDQSDVRREAYWGFRLGTGSSETACAMMETLLDILKIDHIRVRRSAGAAEAHEWLMVDYGTGWLYVDVMPTDGYVWTTDGRLLLASSSAARSLTRSNILAREAMTQKDLDALTGLSNKVRYGWNYYETDMTDLPPACERREDNSYTRPRYNVWYISANPGYGSIEGLAGQQVLHGGRTSEVTAIAAKGYKFVSWSDGNTDAWRSDDINRPVTFTAIFEPDSDTIKYFTLTYEAEVGGSIIGEAVQSGIRYGEFSTVVTAAADEAHYFIAWSDGRTEATRNDRAVANETFTALFGEKIAVRYEADAGGSIGCNGAVTPVGGGATVYVMPGQSSAAVTAIPDKGYKFSAWSDGLTTATRSDAVTEECTFKARFVKDAAQYTVTYTASEGGRIEGTRVQMKLCWSNTSPVRAVADDGYVFVSWSDGKTEPTRSDVVYGNETYTAIFRKLCTVIYMATDGGSISGAQIQYVGEGESTQPVTAVPNDGYVFVSWSDGSTDATRTDIPASADAVLTVAAEFRLATEDDYKTETSVETPAETPTGTPVEQAP